MSDRKNPPVLCRRRARHFPRHAQAAPSFLGELHASLSARLRELRIERGYSRKALAEVVGLSVQRVQEHECSVRRIRPDELLEYALRLNVRPLSFFVRPSGTDARS